MKSNKVIYIVLTLFSACKLVLKKQSTILKKLDTIINNLKTLKMTEQDQFDAVIERIDTATTHLAAQITNVIIPEIQAQGLPKAAEDSILSKLTDFAGRLESIGASVDNPLPGVVGSTTPVPLGEGNGESNTGATEAANDEDGTTTQPVIDDSNTGQNTPPSDGAETDQSNANATMNPNPQPVEPLPGDNVTNLNGEDTSIQVGKQPDANNGDTQTDPNKDSNPANDEDVFINPEEITGKKGKSKKG